VGNAVDCYCLGMEERAEGVGNAIDCYYLRMEERNERKVWAMLLTVVVIV
jgi:hypothetical protein